MGFETIATAVLGSLVSGVVGSMMSDSGGGTVATPAVKPPTPMPVAPGGKEKAKMERTLAQQMGMNRASTVLTDETLG